MPRSGKRIEKTSIEKIRRADLVEAAFQTFLDLGLSGMTMARIGQRAGMSHGIVNYYFKNKDELLNVVMRKANCQIMQDVIRRLKQAGNARERISAVIAGNFPDDLFTRDVARAWVSFYSAVSGNADFEALQNAIYRRLRSNLLSALRELTDAARAERIAQGISVWIDGQWLRQAMGRDGLDAAQAIRRIELYVDEALASASAGGSGCARQPGGQRPV
jgi:TetR/AcrR family transcriptional regulator, transcriptional repressor of bet genes